MAQFFHTVCLALTTLMTICIFLTLCEINERLKEKWPPNSTPEK